MEPHIQRVFNHLKYKSTINLGYSTPYKSNSDFPGGGESELLPLKTFNNDGGLEK